MVSKTNLSYLLSYKTFEALLIKPKEIDGNTDYERQL